MKGQFVQQKFEIKLSEMGKDMKIKHSVSIILENETIKTIPVSFLSLKDSTSANTLTKQKQTEKTKISAQKHSQAKAN